MVGLSASCRGPLPSRIGGDMDCAQNRVSEPQPGPRCVHLVRCYNVPLLLDGFELDNDVKQMVDTDADWIWRGVCVPSPSRVSTVLVRFQVGDYFLSNTLVPLALYGGSGIYTRALEREIFVARGSRISLEVQNTDAAAFTGSIVLLGVKIRECAE